MCRSVLRPIPNRPNWNSSGGASPQNLTTNVRSWPRYTFAAASTPKVAETVADQLMAHDALGAHARDELGLFPHFAARPLQAAWASAATFAAGAALPLVTTVLASAGWLVPSVAGVSLLCLATLGAVAAWIGGAPAWIGAARVTFWGLLAMVVTSVGRGSFRRRSGSGFG
jgi:VIT1/CCC1 family predicted Fe2+/Mn2+ transporter